MTLKLEFDYACERLRETGITIHDKDKQILRYAGSHLFKLRPLKTKIRRGELLLQEDKYIQKITNEEDLAALGYAIYSEGLNPGDPIFFTGQRKRFWIGKLEEGVKPVQMPDQLYVEYSVVNKALRLVGRAAGPFGYGHWVDMSPQTRETNRKDYKSVLEKYITVRKKVLQQTIDVEELPIMISDRGELVCIPLERDEPTIGIVGVKRTGKSFCLHGIADRSYWKWGKKVAILNDALNECLPWATHWHYEKASSQDPSIVKQIRSIGEDTRPLPCVFITPMTDTLRDWTAMDTMVGHRMSYPFIDLILNYSAFSREKKEWRMTNSGRSFRAMLPELIQCRDMEAVEKVVFDALPGKGDGGVRNKILSTMQDIFDRKFLDVNTGVSPRWKIKMPDGYSGEYSPPVACLLAGIIPIIQTRDINTKDYFPQYFRYIVNDIFKRQTTDPYFVKNNTQIWLFVDEITGISSTQKPGPASEILQQCVAEGGPARVGFIYATQNYSKVQQRIRSNTKYLFAFRFNNSDEAKAIAADFGLSKTQQQKILKLKKFEMMALTSERFICYDSEGNKRYTDEPMTGRSLPPLSTHKTPKQKEEEIEYEEEIDNTVSDIS